MFKFSTNYIHLTFRISALHFLPTNCLTRRKKKKRERKKAGRALIEAGVVHTTAYTHLLLLFGGSMFLPEIMDFRRACTTIHSTHGCRDHPPACTLMHLMSHGLACSTCVINCQECCSELADRQIGSAKEQDLRQPRVSSSSRFKTFFFLSLSSH